MTAAGATEGEAGGGGMGGGAQAAHTKCFLSTPVFSLLLLFPHQHRGASAPDRSAER